jgi:hypothetical protein
MRAWEQQPAESAKAFSAFKIYRDLGPQRSLQKTAEAYYGCVKNLAQIGRWSSGFDWVERAKSHDAWLEMVRREAVEEHERRQATSEAERRGRIRERLLTAAEAMGDQVVEMARWPLSRREVVQEDAEGRPVAVKIYPSRWSKRTTLDLVQAVSKILEDQELVERVEALEESLDETGGSRWAG